MYCIVLNCSVFGRAVQCGTCRQLTVCIRPAAMGLVSHACVVWNSVDVYVCLFRSTLSYSVSLTASHQFIQFTAFHRGSVLGFLLFLLHTADVGSVPQRHRHSYDTHLYASCSATEQNVENGMGVVRGHPRSLKMAPFDKAHTNSY